MQGEPEDEQPGPSSRIWKASDFEKIPAPAAQKIFFYLRYDELKSVQAAVHSSRYDDLVGYGEILLENRIKKCSNFIWHRFYEEHKEEDRMPPRVSHSMTYHEAEAAMYIFGGRALPNRKNFKDPYVDEESHDETQSACFNDLWKLDLVTKNLSRIFVTTTPYPLPKCGAAMVLYNNELLLYGGRRPVYMGHSMSMAADPNTNEIHTFNTKTNAWNKIMPINEGPSLFGHSAVVCDDLLIAYGGTMDHFTLNTTFRVLDLKKLHWFTPTLPGVPAEFVIHGAERVATEFPIYGQESTSLIKLTPGNLLLLGEGRPPSRRNVGVLISYDVDDPEGKSWTWRVIPASGKWFECQKRQVGPSKHRNSNFCKVVALEGDDFIRLVTVGLPSSYFQRDRPRVDDIIMAGLSPSDVDTFVDGRCNLPAFFALALIRDIQGAIDSTGKERHLPVDFVFTLQGVHVKVANFYIIFEKAKRDQFPVGNPTTTVWIDKTGEHFLGELDPKWLELTVRRTVDHYVNYYAKEHKSRKGSIWNPDSLINYAVRSLPPPPVDILKQQPHLVSYSALIPLGDDWTPDKLKEIKYEEGESHYHCPPTFHDFAMCAGRAEVIMNGGDLTQHRMPHVTYFMIPSKRQRRTRQRPSTSQQ